MEEAIGKRGDCCGVAIVWVINGAATVKWCCRIGETLTTKDTTLNIWWQRFLQPVVPYRHQILLVLVMCSWCQLAVNTCALSDQIDSCHQRPAATMNHYDHRCTTLFLTKVKVTKSLSIPQQTPEILCGLNWPSSSIDPGWAPGNRQFWLGVRYNCISSSLCLSTASSIALFFASSSWSSKWN